MNVIRTTRLLTWVGSILFASLGFVGCADPTSTTAPTTAALSSVTLSVATVVGGTSLSGVVTLTATAPTGGAVVTLSSSSTAVTVPASVTIAAGSTALTFTVATTSVAATTSVTATYAGVSQTATLVTTVTVVPTLQDVLLATNVAVPGGRLLGTLTLTSPAAVAGLSVSLKSNTAAAIVPATVFVPFGSTSQTFDIDVDPLTAATGATITASYAGVVRAASFAIGQLALSIGSASIPGGVTTTGTVSLPAPAPDGGATIALSSSSAKAAVPSSVVVPAGAAFQTFAIATSDIAPTETATISATYGAITRTATLTVVAYPVVVGVNCTPSSPSGGVAMLCTGTLAGPSPATGWRLTVASSDPSVTPVSPVTIAPLAQTFQFTLQTATVTTTTLVTIQIFDSASGLTLWTAGLSIAP